MIMSGKGAIARRHARRHGYSLPTAGQYERLRPVDREKQSEAFGNLLGLRVLYAGHAGVLVKIAATAAKAWDTILDDKPRLLHVDGDYVSLELPWPLAAVLVRRIGGCRPDADIDLALSFCKGRD
jgi:hypothetical protein